MEASGTVAPAAVALHKYPDAEEQKSSNVRGKLGTKPIGKSDKSLSVCSVSGRVAACVRRRNNPAAPMMFLVVLMRTIKDATRLPIN